ncbi:MAG: hypothetical protein U1D33_00550, partial [bacterium]|nr:hypothetical protein [bacterium]
MMPIHTATLFTSLGFANVSSALQLFQQVPETGLERVLPEMEALDGALAAAGLQDGRDSFGWEAPKDLHARLCRLITGIDDPAAWKNVYRFSIQALKNQALRLDSPRTPISQHPLKEIVRKNGLVEKSRLSILVETGATEDQIRSIDPLSKRLRISLRGEEEGPNALKAFFALHMGMDLERMRVKASSNDLRKKSLVFPTEELLFVLDRLNLLGPRLIDRGTRKRLEFSLLAVRGALEEMRDHLSFAEGILQNFTAPEEQKSPPLKVSREIFGTLQLLLSNADKARTSCEEMWKASAPH